MVPKSAVIIFFRVIDGLILLRFLFSLVVIPKENKLKQFIITVTEPVLSPVRKMIAHSAYAKTLMFDASPFIAFILLGLLEFIILRLLSMLGI
jgi:YggT family protein